jgi:hypothetical protein
MGIRLCSGKLSPAVPNDHYIQRALIERWSRQRPDGGWDNHLRYFDFRTGSIGASTSYQLFSKVGLNPSAIELRLNQLIESPLTRFRKEDLKRHQRGGTSKVKINDHQVLLALSLLLYVQTARVKDAVNPDDGESSLARLLAYDQSTLEAIAADFQRQYQFASVALPRELFFFFPETGFFQLPVMEKADGCVTGWTFGYALPLTPRTAFLAISPTGDIPLSREAAGVLAGCSVGLNDHCSKVIIPSYVCDQWSDERLAEAIPRRRAEAIELISNISQVRELVAKAYQLAGIELGPVRANATATDGDLD